MMALFLEWLWRVAMVMAGMAGLMWLFDGHLPSPSGLLGGAIGYTLIFYLDKAGLLRRRS
ncbi:hypothetical protein [Sandaracinobacteroides saxicola]|uniref:Uncharacterized protein n=1 Tax=Sandaracinobacteroides saxicola TaxID=2759707 RepID=A0A7G5IEQ2_9SPHN|nr:hypothetical protein [Sandaracinobacteroides saxicola]QMW21844.1 hypothetical protein H3309_10605 [Sandaracinobacteroides saxicola]